MKSSVGIVGFDDLGNTDNFSTTRREYRLIEAGYIMVLTTNAKV
jgi:hypothetical protein